MEDLERIEEAKKMSRNYKLSVVYGKQDLHSFMNQSRPEGLSDQESTGPRLRFVSISEIVQENPRIQSKKRTKIYLKMKVTTLMKKSK